MKNGFLRTAAVSFDTAFANCRENAEQIVSLMRDCQNKDVSLAVFPELSVTGASIAGLFTLPEIINESLSALSFILDNTKDVDIISAVGLPFEADGRLYNAAAIICRGKLLGIIPKSVISIDPFYNENRYFSPAKASVTEQVMFFGEPVPFGTDLIFESKNTAGFTVSFEIGTDAFSVFSPLTNCAASGALLLGCLAADTEEAGKADKRRAFVKARGKNLLAAYIYSAGGGSESTADVLYTNHSLISENGHILAEGGLSHKECGILTADIDTELLLFERRRLSGLFDGEKRPVRRIPFESAAGELILSRNYSRTPFIPENEKQKDARIDEVFSIQARAFKKRIESAGARKVLLGISGGMDSTLALLVSLKALELAGRSSKDILALTMPGPGTTARSFDLAKRLCAATNVPLKEISISDAVYEHLSSMGHDKKPDIAFENAQARKRMHLLMDTANMTGGIVAGTPDLSEIALGFSTYGGDHMSMYGVNSGIPKTLMRCILEQAAKKAEKPLCDVLYDILALSPSPELLPPDEKGETSVETEKVVGEYVLHDFILFYFIRYGFSKEKILRLMRTTFTDYDSETLTKTLDTFFTRFFKNQFKRSTAPDGVKIGSVSLFPRTGFYIPGDGGVLPL